MGFSVRIKISSFNKLKYAFAHAHLDTLKSSGIRKIRRISKMKGNVTRSCYGFHTNDILRTKTSIN